MNPITMLRVIQSIPYKSHNVQIPPTYLAIRTDTSDLPYLISSVEDEPIKQIIRFVRRAENCGLTVNCNIPLERTIHGAYRFRMSTKPVHDPERKIASNYTPAEIDLTQDCGARWVSTCVLHSSLHLYIVQDTQLSTVEKLLTLQGIVISPSLIQQHLSDSPIAESHTEFWNRKLYLM